MSRGRDVFPSKSIRCCMINATPHVVRRPIESTSMEIQRRTSFSCSVVPSQAYRSPRTIGYAVGRKRIPSGMVNGQRGASLCKERGRRISDIEEAGDVLGVLFDPVSSAWPLSQLRNIELKRSKYDCTACVPSFWQKANRWPNALRNKDGYICSNSRRHSHAYSKTIVKSDTVKEKGKRERKGSKTHHSSQHSIGWTVHLANQVKEYF